MPATKKTKNAENSADDAPKQRKRTQPMKIKFGAGRKATPEEKLGAITKQIAQASLNHQTPLPKARVRTIIITHFKERGVENFRASPEVIDLIADICFKFGLALAGKAATLRRSIGKQRQVSVDCVEAAAKELDFERYFHDRTILTPVEDEKEEKEAKA